MIKVLHLRSSFDPGGTETLLLNLFNHKQKHFAIHLVLLKKGRLIKQLDESGGNVRHLYFRKNFLDLHVLKEIYRLIKREKIFLIHTHQFIELFYAFFLKILNPRLKIIHHIHLLYKKKNWVFYLEKHLSRIFCRIITVSYATKNELVQCFGFKEKHITVLYNAIQWNEKAKLSEIEINEKLGVPLDKSQVNIVMVANFVWGKDHETLFKAYDDFIRDQLPEVSFYFIGRKSEISEMLVRKYLTNEDLKNGRVVICGQIPNAQSLLDLFDLVVMSSFSETFNIALIEAACTGKTILASDIPVFLELNENGKYFTHFETGNARDFFEKLKHIIEKKEFGFKKEYAQIFKEKFSFNQYIDQLNQIYMKGLNQI